MASQDKDFLVAPTSPATFRVIARISTWPKDEQQLFAQAVELLTTGQITDEAFETAGDLVRAGKLTRREAFAYLASVEGGL